ncbi:hypothetical protein HK096_010928 [Nowakowskiella sp. JEL0078]|nr:hypothetical protein HK096_010928 [Nowakowskiella sp. JEL0078]
MTKTKSKASSLPNEVLRMIADELLKLVFKLEAPFCRTNPRTPPSAQKNPLCFITGAVLTNKHWCLTILRQIYSNIRIKCPAAQDSISQCIQRLSTLPEDRLLLPYPKFIRRLEIYGTHCQLSHVAKLECVLSAAQMLEELLIEGVPLSESLLEIILHIPELKVLEIYSCKVLCAYSKKLLELFSNMDQVVLSDTVYSRRAHADNQLTKLAKSWNTNFNSDIAINGEFSKLRSLIILGGRTMEADDLEMLLIRSRNLQVLIFSHANLRTEWILAINFHRSTIHTLTLHGSVNIEEFLSILVNCESLRHMDVRNVFEKNDRFLGEKYGLFSRFIAFKIPNYEHLRYLQSLTLAGWDSITEELEISNSEILWNLLNFTFDLKSLSITPAPSPTSFMKCLGNLQFLRYLNFSDHESQLRTRFLTNQMKHALKASVNHVDVLSSDDFKKIKKVLTNLEIFEL